MHQTVYPLGQIIAPFPGTYMFCITIFAFNNQLMKVCFEVFYLLFCWND